MSKPVCRQAYQVMLEDGARSIQIGWKGRLVSRHRANRIRRFLQRRGHDVRVRYFGKVVMPQAPRLFD